VVCLRADLERILRMCCDADWSCITGRRASDRDPVFAVLAQNAVGHTSNDLCFCTDSAML